MKLDLTKSLSAIKHGLSRYSPAILTGVGIAGMICTTVLAVKATPKALQLIEEAKNNFENADSLPVSEVVKATWKCYIPAAITGVFSASCLILSTSVHSRRSAALATAYSISEAAFKEYRDKVVETIGEKKETSIRDAIAKDRLNDNPVSNNEVILTGTGDVLCYEVWSGRYFKSDIEKLRKVENELNREMIRGMYVTLNDFYDLINIPSVKVGDDLGWNVSKSTVEMSFSSQLTEDGTPCLVVGFSVPPYYDYMRY